MEYTTQKRVDGEFDAVVEKTVDALEDAGFGILSDIDIRATFAKKLDEEFRQYRILGACNPELARQGLDVNLELGALLPCNVIVYESDDGDVVVSAIDPERLLGVADDPDLDAVAEDAAARFDRALGDL
ncbi:Uncharacterized conserved protein, DUF302 family [Natronoarchaeum philippinense]|uniref:Uncharacterized conserved protein, DUF302 family n=1 Tax=Natronoarchaeum philippinense TaxID=558529 RepID=A0A285N2G4_NATPI|nr:DUF302 domain-containing protein [Natronoarchaeum philippinense]SNZ03642.1 Uncharacterized conserved protein, DUF302 family [Natronoarchaeum philippinense]